MRIQGKIRNYIGVVRCPIAKSTRSRDNVLRNVDALNSLSGSRHIICSDVGMPDRILPGRKNYARHDGAIVSVPASNYC